MSTIARIVKHEMAEIRELATKNAEPHPSELAQRISQSLAEMFDFAGWRETAFDFGVYEANNDGLELVATHRITRRRIAAKIDGASGEIELQQVHQNIVKRNVTIETFPLVSLRKWACGE